MSNDRERSEFDLLVFISSVMKDELDCARRVAVRACRSFPFTRPWAFEFTPASSESPVQSYLRKVKEADFVIWLIGSETSQPVVDEINTCISAGRRLLAFKLPSNIRCATTEHLIKQVAGYAKWTEVRDDDDLAQHIQNALSDELVRVLRDPAPPVRTDKLTGLKQLSFSRCKRAWTSLGVPDEIATELAEDQSVGDFLEFPNPGVTRIEGDQGSGKSLAAERLFQKAVDLALVNSSQPFPLFVSARDLHEPILEYIDRKNNEVFRPSVQGVLVIIDGVDEVGVTEANKLLNQGAIYADTYSKATVVVTSRPLPGMIDDVGEKISLPEMEADQRMEVISRIAGRKLEWLDSYLWPASVRDAAKRPLFAVMIGSVIRDQSNIAISRPGQLASNLAERALQEVEHAEVVDILLQELAVKTIKSGKRIRSHDISPRKSRQRLLANSRLVNEEEGTLDFTLPIFREWYAARALLENTISIDEIQSTSDRWTIPLTVAIDSGDESFGNSLMTNLASSDPGLASLVLQNFKPGWLPHETRVPRIGTNIEVGKRIRMAMEAWRQGLGDVFSVIGPADPNGNTATLGIGGSGPDYAISWYRGTQRLPPVFELQCPSGMQASPDWPSIMYSALPHSKLWPWVVTMRNLAETLTAELESASLALTLMSTDTVREFCWALALAAMGNDDSSPTPIGIRELIEFIEKAEFRSYSVSSVDESTHLMNYIEILRRYLLSRIEDGEDFISDPWPLPYQVTPSDRVLNGYNSQKLLKRTKAVYEGALRIYRSMVDHWFNSFRHRLGFSACMPVRLEGRLDSVGRGGSARLGPVLSWYPRPLPADESSSVAFESGTPDGLKEEWQASLGEKPTFFVTEVVTTQPEVEEG